MDEDVLTAAIWCDEPVALASLNHRTLPIIAMSSIFHFKFGGLMSLAAILLNILCWRSVGS